MGKKEVTRNLLAPPGLSSSNFCLFPPSPPHIIISHCVARVILRQFAMRIKFHCSSDARKCCDTLGSLKLATLRPIINQNNTQEGDASVNTKCQHHKAIKVSTTRNVLTELEGDAKQSARVPGPAVC